MTTIKIINKDINFLQENNNGDCVFHWQSQNQTAETSTVGQRYIHHKETENKILLFVRDEKKNKYGETATYTFLGTANYKSHEGSKPMNIIWELDFPIPAKYIKETQKMVAIS